MWFTDFNNTSKQSYRGRKYNFNMNKNQSRELNKKVKYTLMNISNYVYNEK